MISMPCISLMEMNLNNVLVLDTETTGLDPETDELLQIAIVEYDGDGRFSSFFRPERHREWPEAMKVNHITPGAVERCATAFEYRYTIQRVLDSADALVGYNVGFDLAFLEAIGVRIPPVPVCDVMRDLEEVWRRASLGAACAHFGIDPLCLHDAWGDCISTIMVSHEVARIQARGPHDYRRMCGG